MASEYKEYRRKRESHKETPSVTRKFFKKIIRQTLLSIIIFISVIGFKAATADTPGKISIFFRTAMTKPMNTHFIQNLFNNFIQTPQDTKEGHKNEKNPSTPEQVQ